MNLKDLLKKADKVAKIKKVTEGFPQPTENASSMMPQKDRTPSKPDKHIRADTQSELNFIKENELKKDDDLEKVYYKNGRAIPEKSDHGKPHPENDHKVGHIDKTGNPTWAYSKDVNERHAKKIMDNFNGLKMSPHGKTKLQKLIVHIAKDPDNHALVSGTTPNAEGKFKELRLRHLSNAMTGRGGSHVKELEDGSIEIHAPRHTQNPKYQGESTTWHFDGKKLKSTHKNPIGNIVSEGGYSFEKNRQDGSGSQGNAGKQGLRKTDRPRLGVIDGGVGGDREGDAGGESRESKPKGSYKSSWRVKIKGIPGYHMVKDIIPPNMDAEDQSNYYETKHGVHHQRDIEDMQFSQSLEKVIDLGPSSHEELSSLFNGYGVNHKKTNKLSGGLYHHVFQEDKDKTRHTISNSPRPSVQGLSEVVVMNDPNHVKEGPHIHFAGVHDGAKGRGLGKIAYRQAIKHHGELYSDKSMTPKAAKVWQSMSENPDFHVELSSHPEGSHKVSWARKSKEYKDPLLKSDRLEKMFGSREDKSGRPISGKFSGHADGEHIKTTKMPNRLYYHSFKQPHEKTYHLLSYSQDPSGRGIAEVVVNKHNIIDKEAHHPAYSQDHVNILKNKAESYIGKTKKRSFKDFVLGKNDEKDRINLVHFSKHPDLQELDPNYMGTGTHSPETKHGVPSTRRTFYYREGEGAYEPSVTGSARHKYKTSIPKDHKLHNIAEDTGGIYKKLKSEAMKRQVNPGMVTSEEYIDAIKDAGFHGYYNSGHSRLPHVVALFHKQPVKPLKKGVRRGRVLQKDDKPIRRDGAASHNEKIRSVADSYNKKHGLGKIIHSSNLAPVNKDRAKAIANYYENARHDPHHPEVKEAYNALISETLRQYDHIKAEHPEMKFSKMKPGMENPYASGSGALHDDVKNNNHMWYFPTEEGYGSSDHDASDHPLLQNVTTSDGTTMPANDLFRIVHDYFGHSKDGFGFGPRGEESAWRSHMQMYTPAAQKALTAETRGQNSTVNFGKFGEQNRKDPANTVYADQKATILPDWGHSTHDDFNPGQSSSDGSEDLGKGAAQRLFPFDPQKEISGEADHETQKWTSGDDHEARERIPESPRNAIMRGIRKYAKNVRKHPESGKTQILLHRGMHNAEADSHASGINHSMTSWTPKYEKAKEFAEHYSSNAAARPKSAWVDVDQIHAIPNTYGGADEAVKDEHEFIIKPHKMDFVDHEPEKIGMGLNEKINARGDRPKLYFFGKSEDLEKALPEGKIYIAMDGDNAGSQVERAALKDDTEAIKDISNRISTGSAAVIEHAKKMFGDVEVVVSGGDDLGFLVNDSISKKDVDVLRSVYKRVAGFSITAGIGDSIPKATRALLYGKITGKDKTVPWSNMVEKVISDLSRDETPEEKAKGILNDE